MSFKAIFHLVYFKSVKEEGWNIVALEGFSVLE